MRIVNRCPPLVFFTSVCDHGPVCFQPRLFRSSVKRRRHGGQKSVETLPSAPSLADVVYQAGVTGISDSPQVLKTRIDDG
jgi:hypothetical protein